VPTEHVVVRVIDYTVGDGRGVETVPFRLFTTMLDPAEVTATELAAAYAQRWEIERSSTSS
jgi:IS4 transposase